MFLDVSKYQYYMIDAFGRKIYAQRNKSENTKPISNSFPTSKPDIVNGKELISFSEMMQSKDLPF